jgi:hypothetical protein
MILLARILYEMFIKFPINLILWLCGVRVRL